MRGMTPPPADAHLDPPVAVWRTVRRGIALSPTLRTGLPFSLCLALVATAGRAVIPVAIQRTIDEGIGALGGVDVARTAQIVAWAAVAVLITAVASGWMNWRLAAVVETALSQLRVRAFRHVHDLSMLHQQTQQRGVLVSRVTTDVDEISRFMQWAGLNLITAMGQLTVATVVMLFYSWQLALVVFVLFVPFVRFGRLVQQRLSVAYLTVRENLGHLLGVISETVVGAPVVRAYGIQQRTTQRLDDAIETHRSSAMRVGRWIASFSASSEIFGAVATSAVVVVGVWLGVAGQVSAGTVVAFLFLITLFVEPVLMMGEVINEGQTAVAGWRRVLDILDVEPDLVDPGEDGTDLPHGPLSVAFRDVGFVYPPSRQAAPAAAAGAAGDGAAEPAAPQRTGAVRDIDVSIAAGEQIAVVGATGSGKTTFAKLLVRLMDPTSGTVELAGIDLRTVRFASLRRRVVMVPQEGMLLSGTIADNVQMGSQQPVDDQQVVAAFAALGLDDWLAALPDGTATQVGERGGNLSAGERQFVALARAMLADPSVLVLDEATSAVDPAAEVRLRRALAGLTSGRTTVTVAHRLATAQRADRVVMFEHGAIVGFAPHDELLRTCAPYANLFAKWMTSTHDAAQSSHQPSRRHEPVRTSRRDDSP